LPLTCADSEIPSERLGGYDKKNLAKDIHELVRQLGYDQPAVVVGHDIRVDGCLRIRCPVSKRSQQSCADGCLSSGGWDWKNVWLMRDLWHFHFHGETPLALVKGRERTISSIFLEHFCFPGRSLPPISFHNAASSGDRSFYWRTAEVPMAFEPAMSKSVDENAAKSCAFLLEVFEDFEPGAHAIVFRVRCGIERRSVSEIDCFYLRQNRSRNARNSSLTSLDQRQRCFAVEVKIARGLSSAKRFSSSQRQEEKASISTTLLTSFGYWAAYA